MTRLPALRFPASISTKRTLYLVIAAVLNCAMLVALLVAYSPSTPKGLVFLITWVALLALTITYARNPQLERFFEQGLVGALIFVSLGQFAVDAASNMQAINLGELYGHTPIGYLMTFMLLGVRRGVVMSLISLAGMIVIFGGWYLPLDEVARAEHATHLTVFSKFFRVSLIQIALIAALMAFLERQVKARASAEAVAETAYVDTLTGLPNRLRFQQRLDESVTRGKPFNLLFVDLDHFKNVNDTLGHHAGDELLQQFAQRLAQAVSPQDTAARISGDEFALIVHGPLVDAPTTAERALEELRAPMVVGGQPYYASASIGVSHHPTHASQGDQLLLAADEAMYAAKKAGRNTFALYGTGAPREGIERPTVERELALAVERGDVYLQYQPIFDMQRNLLVSLEALARWDHATLGVITPDVFIPVANESRLIIPLGAQLLERACAQNKRWQLEGLVPVVMSVNVSPVQFNEPDFPLTVQRALENSGLEARWLELEITEHAVLHREAQATLEAIRALGVKVSLDDFGTGYSSLSQLQALPISGFKIDRAFIRALNGRDPSSSQKRLIQIILNLAQALDLQVVAEGVETDYQLDILKQSGCEKVQGFFLSKPLSVSDAGRALAEVRMAPVV